MCPSCGGKLLEVIELEEGPCPTCEGDCGDVNDDGDVNVLDLQNINNIISGTSTPTLCEYLAADINGDGLVNHRDQNLIQRIISEMVVVESGACPRCDYQCGDVNLDGNVSTADVTALINLTDSSEPAGVCEFTVGDVKADGALDMGDIHSVTRLVLSDNLSGACEPCTRQCGDVTGSGTITVSDINAIGDHLSGDQPLTDICSLWAAKVTGGSDVTITEDDLDLLTDYIDGTADLDCAQ